MGNWIDLNYSSNPTQGSLTHYFKDMSGGKLKITGKEIHIVTPNTRREYYNMNKMRGHIHKELIQQLDVTEDFSQYDNWTCNANYDHDPDPDTWVDMIIFVWRNVDKDSSIYSGIQNLGFGSYGDLGRIGTFDVDSGQRHINTGTFGGGATAGSYFSGLYSDPFRLVTHEFSHYLLGWNDMHNGIGFWGMLSDWGVRSLVANSFERYQLNWIDDPSNYYTLDASSSSVQTLTKYLEDYVTTGKSIRVIVNSSTNEYFYIENHYGTSYWENHTPFSEHPNEIYGDIEPGIYIIRQTGMFTPYSMPQYSKQLIPADGRFEWEAVGRLLNPYDGSRYHPLWQNNGFDRNTGYHTLELVPHNYPNCENPSSITFVPSSSYPYWENISEIQGQSEDAFVKGIKEIFSPWSNPNNQRENTNSVNFAMKLDYKYSYGKYRLKFYMNNPQATNPSKPENFQLSWYNDHPKLTWDANQESDLSYYAVYKKEGSSYSYYDQTSTTSYIDYAEVKYEGGGNKEYVNYKIKAVDTQNYSSLYSDEVRAAIDGEGPPIEKSIVNNENNKPLEFMLLNNFPNPFNPSTTINYQIPRDGFVNISVFNSLGQEVDVLVNKMQTTGKYSVKFNAINLPSGLYFYRMQSGEYSHVRKMLLTK
ncbi:MAG: T9SS type A sorting domain-containing protein [Melioribacteraceae bacterium]|nr:T9SS type A sorting domain-containing protein [Melioribacteraceae bacterium]